MNSLRSVIQRLRAGVKGLRSLVRYEDHDDWYDTHVDKKDKPPNLMGPGSQGGG
jgi:hypothetical protein